MKTHVVWGPPASGKSTYVNENKGENDLVFDFDRVMQAIGGADLYAKNSNLIKYVLGVRDYLIENVKNDADLDQAWFIVTDLTDDFVAKFDGYDSVEYHLMETSEEDCIRRVQESEDRQATQDEQIEVIQEWFKSRANNSASMEREHKMKKFWNFTAKGEESGELMLYGEISTSTWFGDEVTPKAFKSDLDALGSIKNLNIYINSGGGDVFAGQAIYSMLKRHDAYKTVYVDGLAASIASVIAMAGDKIIMPRNAMMMVHCAWTIAAGNASEFRKMADDMEKIDESIRSVYTAKTGLTDEEVGEILAKETWLTAEDAVRQGFADEVEQEKKLAASVKGGFLMLNGQQFDLSRFENIPEIDADLTDKKEQEEPDDSGEETRPVSDNQKDQFRTIRKKINA